MDSIIDRLRAGIAEVHSAAIELPDSGRRALDVLAHFEAKIKDAGASAEQVYRVNCGMYISAVKAESAGIRASRRHDHDVAEEYYQEAKRLYSQAGLFGIAGEVGSQSQ